MSLKTTPKTVHQILSSDLLNWIEAFLFDRQSARLSKRTIEYYRCSLENFLQFCAGQGVDEIEKIDPLIVRKYLLKLELDHNPGGVHAKYRAVKVFMNWYEVELDDPEYRNPMRKVKLKPVKIDPLEPADIDAVKAILEDCKKPIPFHPDWLGLRDRLIILMLLDTGLRVSELVSLAVDNVDQITGKVHLLHGKGDKPRVVYLSRMSRQALRKYITTVNPQNYLLINDKGDRLTRSGVRQMLESRTARAGVPMQSPHSFRRLCALTMYRQIGDIYAVQRYMDYVDTETTIRYLKLNETDGLVAHLKGSPVDRLLK